MALKPETITSLIEKAAAEERAIELEKEAQLEAKESKKLRADALRKEIREINTQIKAAGQSQEGLRLFIEENPAKTKYETKNKTFTGLPIAQASSQAVVLTPEGIKTFWIDHQINWPTSGQTPSFWAENIKLEDADIKYLFPETEFPSADVLSLKITKLLGN